MHPVWKWFQRAREVTKTPEFDDNNERDFQDRLKELTDVLIILLKS